jgi:hypothetical protein
MFKILFFIFSFAAFAKELKLDQKGSTYKLTIPDNYEYHATFMGLENVIMAPVDKNLGTASLSIYITGLADSNLDAKRLQNTQNEYQAGRKKYINERNLKLIEFIPYELKKNPQGFNIHTIGVIYANETKVTLDKTYMIECPKSFIHSKYVGDVGYVEEIEALKKQAYRIPSLNELEKSILKIDCDTRPAAP